MTSLIFLLVVGACLTVTTATIPDNYKQIAGIGIYRVSTDKKAWEDAAVDCENDLASLAVINSPEESTALKKLLQSTPGAGVKAHVGFLDRDGTGQFRTILKGSLTEAGFNVWKTQPQHAGEPMCGMMWNCGRLGETPCDSKLSYICELVVDPDPTK